MPRRRIKSTGLLLTTAAVLTATAGIIGATWQHPGQPDEEETEAVVFQPNASTGSCGVERWSVKTGTDADASKIALQSTTSTSIAALGALTRPSSLPANNRITPTETTVYRLAATLTEYKLEADSDYHLVLSDASGNTLIGEIPDPACVGSGSPLASSITKARAEFDAHYTPSTSFQTANVPVTVTGVGFFDFLHGQTGVAPNGIELHAILDMQFGSGSPSPSPTPSASASPSASPTASASASPTASASPDSCTPTQLLGNPGFETGTASPWTASSGVISNSASEPPHSGSWDAWLDGYGTTTTDTLAQQVSIPSGCTNATLGFYLHIDTAETSTTTAYDTLKVQILSPSGTVLSTPATYSNLDHNTGYAQHTFDLSAYAGQSVTVKFTGTEDSTKQTSFVLDDTSLATS
jgi:hypothetical protein